MKKTIALLTSVVLLGMAVLTGCGSSSGGETTADGYAKEIYLYNWSEYMTQDVMDKFEAETGIKVVQSTFESNDELLAKLVAGNKGEYDIAVPTNYYISALKANDLLEPFDEGAITNLSNIDPAYLNLDYDPNNEYSVPYMGTLDVWIGNKAKLAELGVTLDDFEDLKDPKLAGNIIITDDPQEDITQGMVATGCDPLSTESADIQKAKEFLISINDNVKSYSTTVDTRDAMARGEAAVALMYSGEALQALAENPDLEVVLTDKPKSLSLDSFVLLKGSEHKKEAQMFIDFCLRDDIAAELTDEYRFVCFNQAAVENLPDDLKSSPVCVLNDEIKNSAFFISDLDSDALAEEVDAITEIKSSR